MLVLSRKIGEEIVLPECGVTVSVLGVSSKRVRLGIEGPSDVRVFRAELWRRILELTDGPQEEPQPNRPDRELSTV
jgi:carbon storage regulator